jgi:hypothetical protein
MRLREMVGSLPERLDVWRRADCEIYGPENLYRYINGGAELYISFRFTALVSQPYLRENGVEIRLDLFDMGSAASAYGIFRRSSEAVDHFVAPEVESEYAGGLLQFWKGPYYASILAYPETESGKALLRELARGIADQIDDASGPPAIVALLPEADLVPRSVRYFLHHVWLNDYHHFGDENPLLLGNGAEAAMARYRSDGAKGNLAVLVAVRYPGEAAAANALANFARVVLPAAADDLQASGDGKWLGCRRAGDLVIVVADALDRETATNLLRTCAERYLEN